MTTIALNMFQTAGLAMLLLVLGRTIVSKSAFLQRCCIPAPVIGGLIFAILHLVLYMAGILEITFDETVKTLFMNIFFCSIGFTACFRLLKKGGKKVFMFLGISIVMVCLQNIVAGGLAGGVFGWDARLGLCTGSIPMVGGHGTAGSYGPLMEDMGIAGANVLGIAAATYGLVSGSLMGGPIAKSLITKYNLKSTDDSEAAAIEDMTAEQRAKAERMDTESFTNAAVLLFVALAVGTLVTNVFNNITIAGVKFTFPGYIGAMVVAAIIRNVADAKGMTLPASAIDTWGNSSLSIFLAIALMTLKLWQLAELAIPMIALLVAQTVLMFIYARFVVFNVMGKDYEAAVMTSAFCGFGMGATPNAMANMQALTSRFGPAPQAFFVVPLVGSLFIDFFNGLIITGFLNVLPMIFPVA